MQFKGEEKKKKERFDRPANFLMNQAARHRDNSNVFRDRVISHKQSAQA